MLRMRIHFVPQLAVCLAVARCVLAVEPEDIEPPAKYTLIINGKASEISESEPILLKGEFKNPDVLLRVDPHRRFPYAGFNFRYPRHFTFAADLTEKHARTWTLSGTDAKIMIADLEGKVSLATYASAVSDNLGNEELKILDRNLVAKFGDQSVPGLRTKLTVGVVESSMDFFLISTAGGRSRFIVFMDGYLDGGHTKEGVATLALLKESFVLTRK